MIHLRMNHTNEKGAVSLFIVIFTALLVTIVATSFIQIMLKNQQQASNNDLSQSAYDSALAGVEDAKRALVYMKQCERNGQSCAGTVHNALNSKTCTSLGTAGIVAFNGNHEVTVGDSALNQAYTCVKVTLDTRYVEGNLVLDGDSTVVRLDGVHNFSKVKVSWFSSQDLGSPTTDPSDPSPSVPSADPTYYSQAQPMNIGKLPTQEDWGVASPPILRTQLIQFNSGMSLGDIANSSRTLFLYPVGAISNPPSATNLDFGDDKRRTAGSSNAPSVVQCARSFASRLYVCSATIDLPAGSDGNQKYLQLSTIYNHTHYLVELLDDDNKNVYFDSVQPEVDSTGRSSDQFRRVKARVSIGSLPTDFPNAALSLNNNLCKNFFITNRGNDYHSECEP